MLPRLHSRFRIDTTRGTSSLAQIEALKKFSPRPVPQDYLDLLNSRGSDMEILVDGEGYIRIWGAALCLEMNEAHCIQTYLPGALAIGDDEGGGALIYTKGTQGQGLYLARFGNLVSADALFIAPSLREFLYDGIGPTIGT